MNIINRALSLDQRKFFIRADSINRVGFTPQIQQVHGHHIVSKKSLIDQPFTEADGIMTDKTHDTIEILTADCLPIAILSPDVQDPLILLHAGWKGIMKEIVLKGLKYFKKLEDIRRWVGPHIGPCCFEVQDDFFEYCDMTLNFSSCIIPSQNKKHFDLLSYLRLQTQKLISPTQWITQEAQCTHCNGLPSYRREGNTKTSILTSVYVQKNTV